MSFEGDTSEGSNNSNSNDGGGGGADADLVYFDESEMRYVFWKIIYAICWLNNEDAESHGRKILTNFLQFRF